MNKDISLIENKLQSYIDEYRENKYNQLELINSMEYSLMAGGKRIRPRFVLEFNRLCGGKDEDVLPVACAIEMIHTYSLIQDDLPCMDDDDMRRGKPSNHIKFGESTALLASDALNSMAFEIMSRDTNKSINLLKAINVLAVNSGASGMIGGQVLDIKLENMSKDEITLDIIREMYYKKTSALIISACVMGAIMGNATDEQIEATKKYATNIGLAFQIVDDILDLTSTTEKLGKPVLSDEKNNKNTIVSFIGIDNAYEKVEELTSKAIDQLSIFDNDSTVLKDIAISLITREN